MRYMAKNMKKIICLLLSGFFVSVYCFSQTANDGRITVEITNVAVNGGPVYLALFSNAESFKNENPEIHFVLEANNAVLSREFPITSGEYVVSAFQDTNNNQKLDYGLLGIPKETVAISNYSGKGFPSKNFDKQKISITATTGKVTIRLYKF
jgi:uncharacterized protein (DUF2141 family)